MSFLLVHVFRRGGIRNLRAQCIRIPSRLITQKRKICVAEHWHQKQEDSSKKAKNANKITLLGPNNSLSVVTLEEAKNLSRRRDLELVKVQDIDTKTQRPVYKLLTKAELLSEEISELGSNGDNKKLHVQSTQFCNLLMSNPFRSSSKKAEKNLTIGSRIADHDLLSRLKNISKWLSKGHEVRILIQCAAGEVASGEKIFDKIETAVKEENSGRIVQKRVKGDHIKFSILPTPKKTS